MVAEVAVVHHVLLLPQEGVLLDLEAVDLEFRVAFAAGLPVLIVILALILLSLLGLFLGLRGTALGLGHVFLQVILLCESGQNACSFGLIVEDAEGLHSGFNDIAIFLLWDWL